MKKLSVIFFILFTFSYVAYGQMHLGLKGGLNIANLSGSDAGSPDSKTGFDAGVFFMYQFNNLFAIQPEAYYTMKGAKQKGTYLGYDYTSTLSLDYIEIPVLLKLIIPVQGSNIVPAVFAGPAIGFNTTHKAKIEIQGTTTESDVQDITSTDFSLVLGAGLGFPMGKNELGFDVRYILGLSKIDDSTDPADVKNTVINFNVYYGFSLP